MRRYDVGSRSPGVLNVISEGLLFGRILYLQLSPEDVSAQAACCWYKY